MPVDGFPETTLDVLDPAASAAIEPALAASQDPNVWVYRFDDARSGWRLSIATHGEPGSGTLSLGGFRIAPEGRVSLPGYDNDREAIDLAIGMEEKVRWSRITDVGGPLAREAAGRIVGGKCVLRPTAGSRVGEANDHALLDWAIVCFHEFEARSGVHLTTGQDLGHGLMSDGVTQSLAYLHERFGGSVLADTSVPTAEGNYHLVRGMLRGSGVEPARAMVSLVGAGNIGRHVLELLRADGTGAQVLEAVTATRALVEAGGVRAWPAERKAFFLALPADAVVVNAAGGSLDAPAIAAIAANQRVRVVCGSENLAMPDPRGADILLAARTLYAPTELGGMMGYLTAVEEYLARRAGVPFELRTVLEAARRLETVGYEAAAQVVSGRYRQTFEAAVRELNAPARSGA